MSTASKAIPVTGAATEQTTESLDAFQKTFFQMFVLSLIICWSPNKMLPYMAPFLAVGWIIIRCRRNTRLVRNSFLLTAGWVTFIAFSALLNRDFIFQNAFLAIVTYGSVYVLLIPSRHISGKSLYIQMSQMLLAIVAIESVIGTIQVFYGYNRTGTFDIANGDFVEGTINVGLRPAGGFETPMFAVNIAFMLLALVPYVFVIKRGQIKYGLLILFGAVVLVLAAVMHLVIFLTIAIVISFFIYHPKLSSVENGKRIVFFSAGRVPRVVSFSFANLRRTILAVLLVVLIPVLVITFMPANVSQISGHYERIVDQRNTKIILAQRIVTAVPEEYPQSLFVGIGPGQFVSRASLIGTGLYFGGIENPRPVPLLRSEISVAVDTYLLDLWWWAENIPYPAGSTLLPFSSWLSVISEFGIIAFFILAMFVAGLILFVRTRVRRQEQRVMAFSFGTGVLLLFLLGFQENYWEVPQAILVGCFVLKVLYANITRDVRLV